MSEAQINSIFDMEPDPAHEARLDAEALAAYESGRVVDHQRVREWLEQLVKGKRMPPPHA